MRGMTTARFSALLLTICARETSADPEHWMEDNPLWGHCAVVALLAQDVFGGVLMRASLTHIPEFAHMRSHYWNSLPHGVFDFTASQFGGRYPTEMKPETKSRECVLAYPETSLRYKLLAQRFQNALSIQKEVRDEST